MRKQRFIQWNIAMALFYVLSPYQMALMKKKLVQLIKMVYCILTCQSQVNLRYDASKLIKMMLKTRFPFFIYIKNLSRSYTGIDFSFLAIQTLGGSLPLIPRLKKWMSLIPLFFNLLHASFDCCPVRQTTIVFFSCSSSFACFRIFFYIMFFNAFIGYIFYFLFLL